MIKPRSRMISIRLPEHCYQGLHNLSVSVGTRTLSDLARDAIERFLDTCRSNPSGQPAPPLQAELMELEGRVLKLEDDVKRLTEIVAR
jgi:hypothetical protein